MSTDRILSLLTIFALGVAAVLIVAGQSWMFDRDFFTYWGGGRGVLLAVNVYEPATWRALTLNNGSTWLPNPIFIYAPPTAIFFAPLAASSVPVAAVAWVWFSALCVPLTVHIIARELRWRRLSAYAPFWSLALLCFLPTLITLLTGQISAFILLLIVLAAALWDRGEWFAGGVLLGITIIKPQPVALLIPMLGLWLVLRRQWHGLIGLGFALGTSVLASFLLFPTFLQDWQNAAMTKVAGVAARMPTVWGLTADLFGTDTFATVSGFMLVGVCVIVSIIFIARWRARALELTGVLAIFALIVTPYLWNYDQITLLLPLTIALIRLDQARLPFHLIAFAPFVVVLITFGFLAIAAVRLQDSLSALVPLFVGFILWWSYRRAWANGVA